MRVRDAENGDRFYEYDRANRLTKILDAQRRRLLVNEYGYQYDLRSQTLADGRQLKYAYGYTSRQGIGGVTVTLPDGYEIDWRQTSDGFTRSWPHLPSPAPRRW